MERHNFTDLAIYFTNYEEFLQSAYQHIQKQAYPCLISKVFKEIKRGDEPTGLRPEEVYDAVQQVWKPWGAMTIMKTYDPQVFIFGFAYARDFAQAIHAIPNSVQGELLTLRVFGLKESLQPIYFRIQNFWVIFTLRSGLLAEGVVARKVAERVGKVLTLYSLDNKGTYTANVLVDLTRNLVHRLKVIILAGKDKITFIIDIQFKDLPHLTCTKCWFVDHCEWKCPGRTIWNSHKNIPIVKIKEYPVTAEEFRNASKGKSPVFKKDREDIKMSNDEDSGAGNNQGNIVSNDEVSGAGNNKDNIVSNEYDKVSGAGNNQEKIVLRPTLSDFFRVVNQYAGMGRKTSKFFKNGKLIPQDDICVGKKKTTFLFEICAAVRMTAEEIDEFACAEGSDLLNSFVAFVEVEN